MKASRISIFLLSSTLVLFGCGTGGSSAVSSSASPSSDASSSLGTSSESSSTESDTSSQSSESSSSESESSSSDSSSSEYIDPTTVFDEDNIVLSFPVITDEHAGFTDATVDNTARLTNTFESLKSFREGKTFDLVMSAGDQTQNGTAEQVSAFMEKYNASFDLAETPFFFSHGNHDTHWAGCMNAGSFYNAYGKDVYQYDLDQSAAKLGNRHIKVNGYHFIAIEFAQYGTGLNTISDQTATWLTTTLQAANEDPSKPIFVVGHSPIHSTIPGSFSNDDSGDWGASKTIHQYFESYHNLIYVSGHTHYNIHDDRSIHQDDITEVQAACTSDLDLDTKLAGVSELGNRRSYSFGEIVEVDSNNNVRISRYDLNAKEMVMEPWEVSHPADDLSHLDCYSDEARAENKSVPYMPDGGKFTVVHTTDNKFSISFNAFQDDKYMIFSYMVRIFPFPEEDVTDEKEDSIIDISWLDDWYNYPQPKSGKINVALTGTYSTKTDWSLKIYAYNTIGESSGMFMTSMVQL